MSLCIILCVGGSREGIGTFELRHKRTSIPLAATRSSPLPQIASLKHVAFVLYPCIRRSSVDGCVGSVPATFFCFLFRGAATSLPSFVRFRFGRAR